MVFGSLLVGCVNWGTFVLLGMLVGDSPAKAGMRTVNGRLCFAEEMREGKRRVEEMCAGEMRVEEMCAGKRRAGEMRVEERRAGEMRAGEMRVEERRVEERERCFDDNGT